MSTLLFWIHYFSDHWARLHGLSPLAEFQQAKHLFFLENGMLGYVSPQLICADVRVSTATVDTEISVNYGNTVVLSRCLRKSAPRRPVFISHSWSYKMTPNHQHVSFSITQLSLHHASGFSLPVSDMFLTFFLFSLLKAAGEFTHQLPSNLREKSVLFCVALLTQMFWN